MKKLGGYHGLYIQSDTFSLLNIRNYECTLEIIKKTNNLHTLHILIKNNLHGFAISNKSI